MTKIYLINNNCYHQKINKFVLLYNNVKYFGSEIDEFINNEKTNDDIDINPIISKYVKDKIKNDSKIKKYNLYSNTKIYKRIYEIYLKYKNYLQALIGIYFNINNLKYISISNWKIWLNELDTLINKKEQFNIYVESDCYFEDIPWDIYDKNMIIFYENKKDEYEGIIIKNFCNCKYKYPISNMKNKKCYKCIIKNIKN